MLCETWTNEVSDVDVEGYVRVSKIRKKKKNSRRSSGGLEVYFKESCINGVKLEEWANNEDGLTFKFEKDFFGWEKDLCLFFVYLKPQGSSRQDLDNENDCFETLLNQMAKVNDNCNILIAGDLNSRISDRQECKIDIIFDHNDVLNMLPTLMYDHTFNQLDFLNNNMSVKRVNSDPNVNDYGSKLIQLCTSCDLAVLNGRAGRDKGKGMTTFCGPRGESTVDFVLCDKYVLKNVLEFDISDHVSYSDHKMLSFTVKCFISNNIEKDKNIDVHNKSSCFTKWREDKKDEFIDKINGEEVKVQLEELITNLNTIPSREALDNVVNELSNILVNAGADHKRKVSNVKGTMKGSIWYDDECKLERDNFETLRKKYIENKTDANRTEMCKQRSKYRHTCRKKRRSHNRKEAEQLVTLSKTNSKKFWRTIKGDNKKVDNIDIDFHEHFKNLAKKDTPLSELGRAEVQNLFDRGDLTVDDLDREITKEELEKAIKELKRDKAAGHDDIVNEFIINASATVKSLFMSIFNTILSLEYFPDKWCVGSIVPIFKSGNKSETNNYRGITLLSVVGKLFTKIMNTRLNSWAEREQHLTEAQFGFRQGRGTTDCLFILQGMVEKMLGDGNNLFAAFIDYEKAFDYLNRGAIWAKLIKGGLSSKCIRIFQSMYEKMKLEVRNSAGSGFFESSTGILQGEITSPIFFSFYVNDLESYFDEASVGIWTFDILLKLLMYADDMVIFSKTKEGLQEGIHNLDSYCKKWGISVNTRKTKVVVFKKGGRINNDYQWDYRGQQLEVVSIFKYLGLYFSATGTFSVNFTETVNTARRALFGLKKIFSKNVEIVAKMQLDLFNSMVLPILFYGCEVWGFSRADPIERFYLSFLKSLLCVKSSTPNCFVYGELGVYPLILERKYRIVKFWLKILRSNDESFLKKMYMDMILSYNVHPQRVSWVKLLRNMLFQYGFGYVWLNQNVFSETSFLKEFRQRIHDTHLQEWHTELGLTSNFRLYKHIKQIFKFEDYLHIYNRTFRIAITKIRLSSHLFFIERGRWNRPKIEANDRKCTVCDIREDEYHCLIECPRFMNERKGCLPVSLRHRPSMYEFINVLKCSDKDTYNTLGLLCFKVMKEYKKYLLI